MIPQVKHQQTNGEGKVDLAEKGHFFGVLSFKLKVADKCSLGFKALNAGRSGNVASMPNVRLQNKTAPPRKNGMGRCIFKKTQESLSFLVAVRLGFRLVFSALPSFFSSAPFAQAKAFWTFGLHHPLVWWEFVH